MPKASITRAVSSARVALASCVATDFTHVRRARGRCQEVSGDSRRAWRTRAGSSAVGRATQPAILRAELPPALDRWAISRGSGDTPPARCGCPSLFAFQPTLRLGRTPSGHRPLSDCAGPQALCVPATSCGAPRGCGRTGLRFPATEVVVIDQRNQLDEGAGRLLDHSTRRSQPRRTHSFRSRPCVSRRKPGE